MAMASVRTLLGVFLRGWWIVMFVASNVHNVAHVAWVPMFVTGTMVSLNWWLNARAAMRVDHPFGALAYGLGAGVGTVTGVWIGEWLA